MCSAWTLASRASCLVCGSTVTRGGCRWPVSTECIECFEYGNVTVFEHWLQSLECASTSEVSSIENNAHVGPFSVHRAGCIDWCDHLHLTAASVVPDYLYEIISIDCNIWVAFVSDNWSQECVSYCNNCLATWTVDFQH